MRLSKLLAALPVFLACATHTSPPPTTQAPAPVPAAAEANPPVKRLEADTPESTPGGVTFTVPRGWTVEKIGARVLLEGQEPGIHIAIVDTSAKSADEAVRAAWSSVRPGFSRPLKISQARPAREGWDEQRAYNYETSPNEKLIVSALALRKGEAWTALLYELEQAAYERRMAQIALIGQSLRPRGYSKESFAGKKANVLDAPRLQRISAMVERGRVALGLPGVAIGLSQGGRVILEQGLGVRELGRPEKVDGETLFIIASNTKALTTLLLATEVDEKKFTWDSPVTQVYPPFRLGDAETTRQVLIKHLICACTGLPRQDFEWIFEFKDATPTSAMATLAIVQPTTRFGETFQYSNLLAAAAGFIGGVSAYPGRELGAAYDLAMKKRIFDPLGMKETTFDFDRVSRSRNHATPHGNDVDGKTTIATAEVNRAVIPVRPAGGAWSNARDMMRYVQMELANGKLPNGKRLVSEESLLARRAPQVAIGESFAYGMGLFINNKYGTPIISHGGDLIGFHSDMFWLPEHDVGGVILTNADGGSLLRGPFIRKVLEELFDGKTEAMEDVENAAKRRMAEIAKARERLVVPPDPAALAMLAPRYANNALGLIDVRPSGSGQVFDFGEWKSAVASRKNDDGTISFITIAPGVGGFEFVVAERDGRRALVLRDLQHEYVFHEQS